MKHIVSFSGGKDSTAMLLIMIEKKMPIDEIRYFDSESWEFPDIHKHIRDISKDIAIPITTLKYKYNFDYMFNQKPVKGRENLGYGFPRMISRWCTRAKISTLNKGLQKDDIMYIGYAHDEQHRVERIENKKTDFIRRYPLIEWQMTEENCLHYCYEKGYNWNHLYEVFYRASCWCCPFKSISELRGLRNVYPELWERLLVMQRYTWSSFRNKKSAFDLDKRFAKE